MPIALAILNVWDIGGAPGPGAGAPGPGAGAPGPGAGAPASVLDVLGVEPGRLHALVPVLHLGVLHHVLKGLEPLHDPQDPEDRLVEERETSQSWEQLDSTH